MLYEKDEREVCFRAILTSLERAVQTAEELIEYPEMNVARIEVIECLDGIEARLKALGIKELDGILEELIKRKNKL